MTQLSERIKNAIEQADLSYAALAELTQIPKSALQRYATGETAKVPFERVQKIAAATGVTASFLLGWPEAPSAPAPSDSLSLFQQFPDLMPLEMQKIPILGEIACGSPIVMNEEYESYVPAGVNLHADFALRARGDSMIGARIKDGDLVFIHKQDIVENGEIAAVIIEEEITLKRLYYYPDQKKLVLMPENPTYEPFLYVGEELNEIRILGKAIAFQSELS